VKTLSIIIVLFQFLYGNCDIPSNILPLVKKISAKEFFSNSDIKRNSKILKKLCVNIVAFREKNYFWKLLLVRNPTKPKGAFWFLPHDDENTAFDSAVYATQKYGGGFLAILSNNHRYFRKQDPNRNFGTTFKSAKICTKQHYPAPLYSKNIFKIIDSFKKENYPYLALHNNKDGYYGNGGSGGVSILHASKSVHSYKAFKKINTKTKGLRDEDSLVYIAGFSKKPPQKKLLHFLEAGLNVKYEVIRKNRNDCSLSNYVVLNKGTTNYINIETEHGDLVTQKKMIDIVMGLIK